MKIVLVLPDQTKLEELKNWWYPPPSKRSGKPSLPSLGVLYLCASIKSGHDAVYIDNSLHRLSDEQLTARIIEYRPDVVGFGGTNQEWPQAASVAAMVKKVSSEIITVYGGPNATARPEKHIHYFDYVFRGMAELSLKVFLDRLEQRKPVAGIEGVCAKAFDQIAAPAVVEDLDTLPWPDRGIIDLDSYQRKNFNLASPTDVVITSRGCPFDCRFCSSQYIWNRRFLKHSVDRVIEEIRFMKDTYGTRSIHFREDNLTVDKERLAVLCRKLAEMGLEWTCQSRINSLDEDTVKMMKETGCRLISCGFESINDSTLQYVRKRQTGRQVLNIIEIFERVGIHYTGAFMVATPNEGKKEIVNTIRFAQQVAKLPHSCTAPNATRFVGIPVSELYFQIIKDGLVEFDWQDGELLFPRTYQMSSAAIDDLLREIYDSASPESADADRQADSALSPTRAAVLQPVQTVRVPADPAERSENKMELFHYQKPDGSFDYEHYKQVQTAGNKRKLHKVWVQEDNIRFLSDYIKSAVGRPAFGLCHGTRRGKEQEWFRKYLGCEVTGTEISDTAEQFPYTIQWDFHETKSEWIEAVDFIYSNSFDHSYDPDKCLNAWMSCLKEDGVCIIEHTSGHEQATELDPFGAHISNMPNLVAAWGKDKFFVHDIIAAPSVPNALEYVNYIIVKRRPSKTRCNSGSRNAGESKPNKKIALVVGLPERLESLRCVIRGIQPQVDEIRILFNEAAAVPPQLAAMDKVSTVLPHPTGEWFASGVWTLLRPDDDGYVFVVDDDIAYPVDYVKKMIAKIEHYGRRAVMVVHGVEYCQPFVDCIDDRVVYRFQQAFREDRVVQTGGVGTLAFHTDTIRPQLKDFPNPNFRDLWFSVLAAKQHVPIVCVAREDAWLKQIEVLGKSIWKMSLQQQWRQQKNEVFRAYLVPLLKRHSREAEKPMFSVFSITNGRSTFDYSIRSLAGSWELNERIVLLRDMHWLDAVNACVERCDTPYFFRVDDDFILHPKAAAYMKMRVLEYPEPNKLGIYYCHLWEDWTSRVRESIKVYSVAALRAIGGFKTDNMGKVDRTTNRLLEKAGFRVVGDPSVVALHACGDWQEQVRYEILWSKMADTPYKKPTHEAMKNYSGTNSITQQYAMRGDFLEQVNRQLNTPFSQFLQRTKTPCRSVAASSSAAALPKVSVVMACHNEEKYLVECLDSILAQTLTDWELLAVDDGSTDRTRNILNAYAAKDSRIRLWSFDDCKGPYVRRNFAIGQGRAPFISIHDADDVMRRDKLRCFYEQISRDPRLGVVGSWYRWFLNDISAPDFGDCMELPVSHEEIMQRFAAWTDICLHGSAIIRKSLFDAIGLFDEHPWGSDSFWLMKAGLYSQLTGKVRFTNIPECLTYIRGRADSQTGRINPHDPRSRRRRLGSYYMQKLCQIATEHTQNPALEVERRLRECTIRDFIPTYGHLFEQWESQPLTEAIVESVAGRIRREFKAGHYVFTVILLNTLETMDAEIAQKCLEFHFVKALSLYAVGHDGPASRYMEYLTETQRGQLKLNFSISDAVERKRRVSTFYNAAYAGAAALKINSPVSAVCPKSSATPHDAEKGYVEKICRQIRDVQSRRSPNRLTPDFSVIVRHYNKGRYIAEAIESVLAQTFRNWELIVVDDASTDNSLTLIQKYLNDPRIKLIRHDKNRGVSVAALTGIAHCSTDLFGELDSDDRLTPDAIEKMVAAHRAHPDCGFIYSQHLQCDAAMNPLRMGFAAQIAEGKSFFETDSAGAFRTFKLEEYLKTAMHDPDLRSAEDKDIILKMEEVSRLHFVPDALYLVREMAESCSRGTYQVVESRFSFGRVRINACKRRSEIHASLTQQPPQEVFMRNLNELAQRDVKIQLYLSIVSLVMDVLPKRLDIPAELNAASREEIFTWIAAEGNIGRICDTIKERLCDGRHDAMVEEIASRFVPTTKKTSVSVPTASAMSQNSAPVLNNTPLVSIILPAYNAAAHIKDAIDSILAQTYKNIEFLIINDGSADDTEQVATRYETSRVRVYSQPNAGVSAARNNGIKRSRGDFIITVDHDDMITPDYVMRHLAMFEKHPGADLVYCDEYLADALGKPIRILEKPEYSDKRRLISALFRSGFPVIPFRGACIRKSVFDKIGLFDESLAIAEDYEIWLRFIRHGLVEKHLKGALYRRRMVENSLSRSHTLQKAQMHFSVVNKFSETFDCTQLFPETDWRKMNPGQRDFYARFLIAKVFISLGQEYRATDTSGVFPETAFGYAAEHLEKCLELSPNDPNVLSLMHKCRRLRQQFAGATC